MNIGASKVGNGINLTPASYEIPSNQAAANNQQQQGQDPNSPAISALEVSTMPISSLTKKSDIELTVSEEAIKKEIEKINKALAGPPTKLEYSVHKPTNTIVVKVINTDTNETMVEIPPEKLLDVADQLQKLAGIMIDEKR